MTPNPTKQAAPAVAGFPEFEPLWDDEGYAFLGATTAADGTPVILKIPQRTLDARERSEALASDCRLSQSAGAAVAVQPVALLDQSGGSVLVLKDEGLRPITFGRVALVTQVEAGAFLAFALGLAELLVELHRQRLVHGRIKPGNIWTSRDTGVLRLADFSQAQRQQQAGAGVQPVRQWHGDRRYQAPEQSGLVQWQVDARTDLYAAGIALFERWAGFPPFDCTDPLDTVYAHLTQAPPSLRQIRPETPPVLEELVLRLLQKAPEHRYQSAAGLLADLKECQARWKVDGQIASFPLGQRDATGSLQIATRLFGRQQEAAQVGSALDRACVGRKQVCLIAGPPGIGKSTLAHDCAPLLRQRAMFLSAKFDQLKKNEPYAFVVQMLVDLTQQFLILDDAGLEAWRAGLREALGATAGVLTELVPGFARVTGDVPAPPALPAAEAQTRFKRVVAMLMRTLTFEGRTCCLLLDDVQWADEGSLEVLRLVLGDTSIANLMVIATYRLGTGDDALGERLASLAGEGCEQTRIELAGLDEEALAQLIAATLFSPVDAARSLAQVLHARTAGNPFFVTQLLTLLHQEGLLAFDAEAGHWQWDMGAIVEAPVPEDLVDIIGQRLSSLPFGTGRTLAIAACLGSSFSLNHLAAVCDRPAKLLLGDLAPALEWGVLRRDGAGGAASAHEGDADLQQRRFSFVHDRLQHGAYMLLAEAERQPLRLRIATALLERLSREERLANPFTVVDNLNAASALLASEADRVQAAELNLHAGQRARRSAAFAAALGYFRAGIDLLGANGWDSHYELAFELQAECFECAYIVGAREQSDRLFDEVVRHARTSAEKGKIYYTKVLLDTATGRAPEAIEIGRSGLRLFGELLPGSPGPLHLFAELGLVRVALGRREPAQLYGLPAMQETDRIAAIRLLMSICPAAYFQNPDLMSLAALRIMRISLKHGNAAPSAFGYVLYGLVTGAVFNNYRLGHEFGQLAVRLAREEPDVVLRSKILMIFAGFVNFWRAPFESSVAMLREAYRIAFDSGDVQYANYAILQILFLKIARGAPLPDLAAEFERYGGFVSAAGDQFTMANYRLRVDYAQVLQGRAAPDNALSRPTLEEGAALVAQLDPGNLTTSTYFHILRCGVAAVFGDDRLAHAHALAAEQKIKFTLSQVMGAEHAFYWGLALVRLMRAGGERRLGGYLKRCERRLRRWSENCPENFAPFQQLLAAEIASLGKTELAGGLYENAIRIAAESGFPHVEALANEAAARFYASSGRPTVAAVYLEAAIDACLRWGATHKAHLLEHAPEFAALARSARRKTGAPDATAAPAARSGIREVDAVLRASTQLAGEQRGSDDLVHSFLHLLQKTTGMDRALLLLAGEHGIEVGAGVSGGALTDNAAESYSTHIARYVSRTGEQVARQAPAEDPRFQSCPYLAARRPQSVMCMPLVRGATLIGAVYLESARSSIVLAREQTPAVQALCQHIAVAYESSRDARRLQEQDGQIRKASYDLAALERVKSHLAKFVPNRVKELIETEPDRLTEESAPTDISVLFLDIVGYTRLSETLASNDLEDLLETYFSAYAQDIHANGGDISEVLGDGLLVLFHDADPGAHAQAATRAALAMMETTALVNRRTEQRWPPIEVHVGINSGLVALGFTRLQGVSGDRWTYSATGSATNIAARIAALASDGEVLVGEATAQRIRPDFALVPLGPQNLKNVSKPVEVFRVR
jgi:predicted ATPase/class 3 adenylate cyclase